LKDLFISDETYNNESVLSVIESSDGNLVRFFCKKEWLVGERNKNPTFLMKMKLLRDSFPKGLLVVLKDISVIQKLEKTKAESEYKEMLMRTVTHELRTPISGVISMLELLDPICPQQGQNYIQVAKNSSLLLLNLINDIMVNLHNLNN
jgi:signal transduction histidine kinase